MSFQRQLFSFGNALSPLLYRGYGLPFIRDFAGLQKQLGDVVTLAVGDSVQIWQALATFGAPAFSGDSD